MKLVKVLLTLCVITIIYSCSDNSDNIEKENLSEIAFCIHDQGENIETRQRRILKQPLFLPCDASNLIVLVDMSDCGDEWDCAINNAIDAYNALPANIGIGITMITDISELPAGESVNVEIGCGPSSAIGQTTPRQSVFDISEITLNENITNVYPCDPGPSCCQLQKTVMHEIGHALGLAHTNGGTIGLISGTPDGEANSIMNTTVFEDCMGGCEFTPGDLAALGILYDECGCINSQFSIEGPEVLCEGEDGTYCISGLDGDATFTWNTPGGQNGATENCREYPFPDAGTYTISAEICSEGVCCDVSLTVFVGTEEPSGSKCYCVCDAIDTYDDTPYIEYIEIDCCDPRDCGDIISDLHGDVIIDFDEDCIRKVDPCKGTPPDVTLTGPGEICEEEGYVTICVSGYSGPTSWTISGPNLSDTEVSNHNCLSYDVEPGTYQFSTRICVEDCCVDLTHTVIVTPGPCEEECYCACEEGDGDGGYTTVELPIDCSEDCDEQYPEGDEYFNCRKMVR